MLKAGCDFTKAEEIMNLSSSIYRTQNMKAKKRYREIQFHHFVMIYLNFIFALELIVFFFVLGNKNTAS
jgi:hypothetical protein